MNPLVAMCREVAAGIPGAKVLPFGGIEFSRRSFPARVEFGPLGSRRGYTDVVIATGGLAGAALLVRPAGLWHDVKNFAGVRDYQVGDPDFDAAFEVTTSEAGFAERTLTPAARRVLQNSSLYGEFLWRVSRAGFLFRMNARPARARELDTWLGAAFQLLDALPEAQAVEQIQAVQVKLKITPDAECQVCGVSLARGPVVRCAKCSTPHHKDCWEFNGRCSTFACGEARATK